MMNNYEPKSVRAAAILTTSYVIGTLIKDIKNNNQLVLYIDFTKGSLTTAEIKIEFSDDGTNFYQEASSSVSAGVDTVTLLARQLTAAGKYALYVPIKAAIIRVSAKGTGTATGSSMTIKAIVGQV